MSQPERRASGLATWLLAGSIVLVAVAAGVIAFVPLAKCPSCQWARSRLDQGAEAWIPDGFCDPIEVHDVPLLKRWQIQRRWIRLTSGPNLKGGAVHQ